MKRIRIATLFVVATLFLPAGAAGSDSQSRGFAGTWQAIEADGSKTTLSIQREIGSENRAFHIRVSDTLGSCCDNQPARGRGVGVVSGSVMEASMVLWGLKSSQALYGPFPLEYRYDKNTDTITGPATLPPTPQSGLPESWTIFSGQWTVTGGKLSNEPGGQENTIWAGVPPITAQGNLIAELKLEFANIPGDIDGRHGGILFFATVPTQRGDGALSGYTIDWIDRPQDRGIRLFRWDNGSFFGLIEGTPQVAAPPLLWRLKVDGEVIRFFGDGQLIFEFSDGTYRDGHFGVWAWNNGTQVRVDDVKIGHLFSDSFTTLEGLVFRRVRDNHNDTQD